jgi:hypothetical protein
MGAWGHGLLQNDDAQDGLCDVHDFIEDDIAKLARRRPAEAMAARLSAGVGLLLHLNAHYSFNPENAFFPLLNASLARQEPMLNALPRRAATLLRELHASPEKGAELVARTGPLARALQSAFFAQGKGFLMERRMGKREPALFEHPDSAAYVQKVADRLLRQVMAGFRRRSETSDLYRDGGRTVAALAILLVIEPCKINGELLRDCWDLYRAANAGMDRGDEEEFDQSYRACLRTAIDAGLHKFSDSKTPAPLEE